MPDAGRSGPQVGDGPAASRLLGHHEEVPGVDTPPKLAGLRGVCEEEDELHPAPDRGAHRGQRAVHNGPARDDRELSQAGRRQQLLRARRSEGQQVR